MGIDKRAAVRDYFSSTPSQFTPWYHQMFDRERFEVIYHTMLHVGEPDATGKTKIEPFVNRLIDSYNNAFTPYQEFSMDEMIIGWKGHWKYKQYNASKPHKYHIKSFGLVDSATGYVLNLLTYYGAETSYDPDLDVDCHGSNSVKIMDTLLKPIGSGYHIFADRWYTTMNLLDYLISKKQYFTGTFQANRVGFPDEIHSKQLKLNYMEHKFWLSEDNKMMCVAWRDKKANKPVYVTSTKGKVENVTVKGKQKPAVIHSYNFSMNGCDRADQMVGYYGLQTRKSKKWWKKIFYWILEITCSNAYILCQLSQENERKKYKGLKIFKLRLIDELCEFAATLAPDATQQVST